jgi:hypothetical protein
VRRSRERWVNNRAQLPKRGEVRVAPALATEATALTGLPAGAAGAGAVGTAGLAAGVAFIVAVAGAS